MPQKDQKSGPIPTEERIRLSGSKRDSVVYVGSRGGKYIRKGGKYVSLKGMKGGFGCSGFFCNSPPQTINTISRIKSKKTISTNTNTNSNTKLLIDTRKQLKSMYEPSSLNTEVRESIDTETNLEFLNTLISTKTLPLNIAEYNKYFFNFKTSKTFTTPPIVKLFKLDKLSNPRIDIGDVFIYRLTIYIGYGYPTEYNMDQNYVIEQLKIGLDKKFGVFKYFIVRKINDTSYVKPYLSDKTELAEATIHKDSSQSNPFESSTLGFKNNIEYTFDLEEVKFNTTDTKEETFWEKIYPNNSVLVPVHVIDKKVYEPPVDTKITAEMIRGGYPIEKIKD